MEKLGTHYRNVVKKKKDSTIFFLLIKRADSLF